MISWLQDRIQILGWEIHSFKDFPSVVLHLTKTTCNVLKMAFYKNVQYVPEND